MPGKDEVSYTKTHEWVFIEGDNATIGISDHAQREMGDVVFVELPKIAQNLEKEKPCAVVESVKSAFDIYAAVTGEVTAINDKLEDDPALINTSPLEEGWMYKIKLTNSDELNDLMDFTAYQEFVKESA
ncbi:MAG: glycine cleavage system protein GcvH [Elusimicrobiota bacterium]|nr:glycine cleavage system protein GcvH [Elusimicrobiota bacterium]